MSAEKFERPLTQPPPQGEKETQDKDWWMAEVIHCGGAARDPSIHNLFQVADVDSGVIRWINADLVTHILADR